MFAICVNGDYIQDEKHVIFSCIGTEHLRHQFIHLFDNISEGNIKGFVFWRSPSHGAQPLGLVDSHQSSHQGAQARPAHPPPPKLAQ